VRFVKSKRMAWLGHVMRMEGKRIPKWILEWKPTGRRNRGRARKRWIDDMEEDIQIMGIRVWRKLCKERKSLRRLKPTVGCNASKRRRRLICAYVGIKIKKVILLLLYYYNLSLYFETVNQCNEKCVNSCCVFSFLMARQPLVGQELLIVKTSRSHWLRHIKLGRTPLDEWSARRRDLCLTTHHSQETDIHATYGIRTGAN
jgi:hypothetical protein